MSRTGFRSVACVVSFLLPLTLASAAGAQSFTDEGEVAAPSAPPISLTQRYVPRAASPARDMSLLVGDTVAPTAPAPVISVTQASGSSLTTGNVRGVGTVSVTGMTTQLAENRGPIIIVSNGSAKAR